MIPQQSIAASERDTLADGARSVVADLVREPVKEAVSEALREESVAVRAEPLDERSDVEAGEPAESDRDGDDTGGSRFGLAVLGVAAALGAVYLVRRRGSGSEQSTWSEFEDDGSAVRDRDGQEPTQGRVRSDDAGTSESTASHPTDE